MENFDDIFNLSIDDFKETEKPSSGSNFFKTDPKEGKDSIFRSVVRFLPNPKNPRKSSIKKYTYWLDDEQGNKGYFDCPSTISEKSIIADTYWKLAKSESAIEQKMAEKLKRKEYYFSLVYIVKDFQDESNNGTIQVWRYPRTIHKLIQAQVQPTPEDIELGKEPNNVFDLFNGKDFSIKVALKGGYWNYDDCEFLSASPLKVNGVGIDNDDAKSTLKTLLNDAPDLEIYEYKAWNDDQKTTLQTILSNITGSNIGSAMNKTASQPSKPTEDLTTQTFEEDSSEDSLEKMSEEAGESEDELQEWLDKL